jgi:hypothetical protein
VRGDGDCRVLVEEVGLLEGRVGHEGAWAARQRGRRGLERAISSR